MFSSDKWFGASAGFYPETIDQSLRFEDGDSAHLIRTPSSAGDRKTFTISFWIKRANLGTATPFLFDAYNVSTENSFLRFNTDDTLRFSNEIGSSFTSTIVTNHCGHTFHLECIRPWLKNNPRCPICIKPFKKI